MPKRPDSLETVQIALVLLRHIPKGRTITAPQLHQQLQASGFQRDLRSIQRLLETLIERFDIERDDSSKPYRYRWKEQAKGLALPGLSAQESLLLTLAEQQLSHLLPVKLMNAMKGFFEQARGTLNTQNNTQRDRQWLEKIRVISTSQPLLPPKIGDDVFLQVSNALYANEWLDIRYQNASGKKTNARVMPLGLAQQGPRMYLVCRFEDYDNERSLALHRLEWAKASGLPFERPKDFNFKQYDDDGRFAYGNGQKIRLRFRINKDAGLHIVECPLSLDQTVKETSAYYNISATVVDSAMLDWWLRGFGDEVSEIRREQV